MNFYDFLHALRRCWLLVVVCAVLGAAANYAYVSSRPAKFTAQAQLFAMSTGADTPGDLAAGANYIKIEVLSYPQLMTTPQVLDKVRAEVGTDLTVADLASKISVAIPPDTMWLNVSVTDTDAQRATDIARSLSKNFVATAERLEARGGTTKPVQITIVDPSSKPTSADNRAKPTTFLIGGFVGLCLGLLLSAAWAFFQARRTRGTATGDVTE